eukprot:Skav213032  [mRNA]  locus=scaffold2312:377744:379492:- [translate_table: standard]
MLSSMVALEADTELAVHQAASGNGCSKRNARRTSSLVDKVFRSKSTCKCHPGFIANVYCAKADIGQKEFTLSEETSPQCMCQRNKCVDEYQAPQQVWQNKKWMCKCSSWGDGDFPHALCGVPWGSTAAFPLEPAKEGCRCLHPNELNTFRPPAPVRVAALNFCKALWMKETKFGWAQTLSGSPTPNMCEQVLAEGLAPSGQKWLKELKDLSKVDHQGYGRLDPLVRGTAVHHHLRHVCADECKNLVKKMTNETVEREIWNDLNEKGVSHTEACADRVVRQVEAEVLGCCADSCGYNGKSCMAWPFFTKAEKVTWLEECCTEYNVLSGSPREKMCNSVLTPDQAKKVSANDVKPLNSSIDVGEPYIGQGPLLLWTEKGVKSELGRYYAQSQQPPKSNGPVASQVMEEHPHIRAEALEKQWFKETNITQSDSQSRATSFMEARRNACDFSKTAHCTETFKKMKQESCVKQRKWQVSGQDGGGCPKDNVRRMPTPEDCFTAFPNEPKVKSFFFEFHNDDEKPVDENSLATPINCYVDTTECGEDIEKNLITEIDEADVHSLKDFTFWFDAEDLPEKHLGPKITEG